ncbi:MAG: hypothetical protein ACLS48_08710 [[Eubacterium] siraeum]
MHDIFTENEDGSYERSCEDFSEIALPLEEIEELLHKAGFRILDRYNYMTTEKGSEDSERCFTAVQRKQNKWER